MKEISISPPLAGDWKFLRPPGHHAFAFDFVQMDIERRSSHTSSWLKYLVGGISSDSYFCWDKPIYSPIEGEVIRVGNGWDDHENTHIWKAIQLWYNATYQFRPKEVDGRLDIRPNAGNHVMIQAEEGYIVFLAHLRNNSILVTEGEKVKSGQVVGSLGNSGNSTMPHLHINLFDQMDDPFQANVLPFVFDRYKGLHADGSWKAVTTSIPEVGSFVRFAP